MKERTFSWITPSMRNLLQIRERKSNLDQTSEGVYPLRVPAGKLLSERL
jgi:hypothetical protein